MTKWLLFLTFARIGLFTLGGGSATIPYLLELPKKFSWVTEEQIAVVIAVGESLPGPGGVNMASYIGFLAAGIPGVLCAVAGICVPSFVIVTLIALFLKRFKKDGKIQHFFYGLRPAVVAGILLAVLRLMRLSLWQGGQMNWSAILVLVLCGLWFWLPRLKTFPPVAVIGASAVLGILLYL